MSKFLIILLGGMILLGCQKDSGSSNSNNNNNNNNGDGSTSGASHSCGAKDVHNPNKTYGTVTDVDGNTYKTIQIGTQTWMAENLKTTKYRNGTPIPNVTDNTQWQNNTNGAYCSYENNASNDCPYGKLYNWYAVTNTNQLCPTGWHVPTNAEWTTLTTFLGGESVAGGKMKSTGTQYWITPNTGATNSSGWSGLPGGDRDPNGRFDKIGLEGYWWSSTKREVSSIWIRGLVYGIDAAGIGYLDSWSGFSVRCLKD